MKKILILAIFTMLTFTTCTKESLDHDETTFLQERVPNALLSVIKSWHENKIVHNETLNSPTSYVFKNRVNTTEVKSLLIPDYSNASYETLPSGATLTTIAADDFYFADKKIGFFRTFVFLEAFGKVIDGKIIEFYGDPDYIRKNRKYLASNYNKKSLEGFTGSIFTYDVYYRPLRNRSYKNGVVSNAVSGIRTKASSTVKKTNTTMGIPSCNMQSRLAECWDVYWVDGESATYLYSFC
jgi:hypothetical protein